MSLCVVFGVNTLEPRFASAASATGSGRALPGMEAGEQRWKLLPNLPVMLKTQKLAAIFRIDWFHNWDAEQNCAQPDCNSLHSWLQRPHAALISQERSRTRRKKKSGFYPLSCTEQAQLAARCAAGTHDSFRLITVQNIWVIGLERRWRSEAKLAQEVMTPRGWKEWGMLKNHLVVHSLPRLSVQCCAALKQAVRGQHKCCSLCKHTAMNKVFQALLSL